MLLPNDDSPITVNNNKSLDKGLNPDYKISLILKEF